MKNFVVISIAASLMLATSPVSAEETLPLKAVNRAKRAIGRAVTEELLQSQGLHDFIDQAQADISTTHNKLSQTWFLS